MSTSLIRLIVLFFDIREFIILDQWIPRLSEVVERLSGIREKMIAR